MKSLRNENEERKDHSFGKRSVGILLLFVCAAEMSEIMIKGSDLMVQGS